jgi:hypothetical protein
MAHLTHLLTGILLGAGTGLLLGFALMIVAEVVEVGGSWSDPFRLGLATLAVPVCVIAGGIWGAGAANGPGAGEFDAALIRAGRVLGGTYLGITALVVVRVVLERPPTPPLSIGVAAAPPDEWRTERVRERLVGTVLVFIYERHHPVTGRRTVDVSIFPAGETVGPLASGNAVVLDDAEGLGTSTGARAFVLRSETADVQLSYRERERVLMRRERVGKLTVQFTLAPEPGRPQSADA